MHIKSYLVSLPAALLIAAAGGTVVAQNPPALVNPVGQNAEAPARRQAGAALSPNSSVDEVLDALDSRGRNLREFVADVSLTEVDTATQLESTRTGRVWYQKQKDDDRIRVTFAEKLEGRFARDEKIEYLLDDGWLIDRDYRRSVEVKRQVLRPGEKVNLLKLGEGPFPLPIGQPKAEVHREFEVTRGQASPDAPKGAVHVRLKPREGTRLARKFNMIDVWVDPGTSMPVRIEALDVNETTVRTTDLKNIRVNPEPGLGDRDFALPKVEEGKWEMHTEPYAD